jgi:serine/threonine protein kinase
VQAPILHRDLKPANLLLDFKDTLKISDFGLAKLRPKAKVGDVTGELETDKFIMTGETGSYRFMAPEVFRHESYNETVDVYSFAMILYNLIQGHPPWPVLNGVKACSLAAIDGERPAIPRDVDNDLATLMRQCWHDKPSNRLSFEQILDALNAHHLTIFGSSVDDQLKKDIARGDGGCCSVM